MEKESFENIDAARLMNSSFINVKVDREELPEVDSIYMEFAQSMMSGATGWPLNVVLTPELHPFFASTFLPLHSTQATIGLIDLLQQIKEVWHGEEREKLVNQATKVVELFAANASIPGDEISPREIADDGAEVLFQLADPVYGGIKGIPKFPIGYQISFLLRYCQTSKDGRALFIAERTLEMMRRGGVYDLLGGGFARYSVDEQWFHPHFEKMLYDNALLASAYFEAWQLTKHKAHWETAKEILHYVLKVMTHPDGGFYSAEDADSDGKEGGFYCWSLQEVQNILGKKESRLFCKFYSITSKGNYNGLNILHAAQTLDEFASQNGNIAEELAVLFRHQRQLLMNVREQRVRPFKDDKILSGWNGLMIYAMAQAVEADGQRIFLAAAIRAARFIKSNLWDGKQLHRRWRAGEASFIGCLEDYAFLIRGLLALFEADCGNEWLRWAVELTAIVRREFKCEGGAYYQTNDSAENIIVRKCILADGAEPSGNAIHCENLLKLYHMTGDEAYLHDAQEILKAVSKPIEHYPPTYCYHLINLLQYYQKRVPTIIIALNEQHDHEQQIFELLHNHFIPFRAIVWKQADDSTLEDVLPEIGEYKAIDGNTTVYICYQGACQHPLTDITEIVQVLLQI
jgi:hypothetical protein